MSNSERARMPVVLNRIEFENYHSVLGVFKLLFFHNAQNS
ncbi:hypothetical protein HMPREF9554_01775 [Treponema phagedenis F0421]|nr:hypothetical protein HMPREF9554_01775 [Treponema phagedenis F0421]